MILNFKITFLDFADKLIYRYSSNFELIKIPYETGDLNFKI